MRRWTACLLYTSTFFFGFLARPPESSVRHGRPHDFGVKRGLTIQHSVHDTSGIHHSHINEASLVKLSAPYEVPISTHDRTNQTSLQIKILISANGDNDSITDESARRHTQHGMPAVPAMIDNDTSEITTDPVSNDTHPLQHTAHAHELPTGFKFLNTHSIHERNASKSDFAEENHFSSEKGSSLDIYLSESDANDSTAVSPFKDNTVDKQFDLPDDTPLDLQSLLSEVGPSAIHHHHHHQQAYQNTSEILQNHEHRHNDYPHNKISLSHDHIHSHHATTKTNAENELSKLLEGLTPRLFEEEDQHQHDVAKMPTTTTIRRGVTNDIESITQRDLQELDGISKFPNTFVNNFLNVQIWNTTFITTTPSDVPLQHTHDKDTSGIHTEHDMHSSAEQQGDSHSTKNVSKNDVPIGNADEKQVLHSDLVHLEGIHVMFSNGKPDTTGHVPTIHLTAHASKTLKGVINDPKTQRRDSDDVPAPTSNGVDAVLKSVERIVGTAIVKNGHLYLIVYPFGENKSVDLHFGHSANNSVSNAHTRDTTPLPSNGSYIVNNVKHSTTAAPSSLSTSENAINVSSLSLASFQKDVKSGSTTHIAQQKSDHRHHHHHPVHRQHRTSKQHDHDTRLGTIDEKTKTMNLSPSKFLSPWKSLNFSKVMPFVSKQRQGDSEDDENDIVKFVANATDPFEKVVSILKTLTNATSVAPPNSSVPNHKLGNTSVFNFELTLQRDFINNTQVGKQPVLGANENSLDEQINETSSYTNNNKWNLNFSGSNEEDTESVMAFTKTNDALVQEYTRNDDSAASSKTPLTTQSAINSSLINTNNENVHESMAGAAWNTKVMTSPKFNKGVMFTTQPNIDVKDPDLINLGTGLLENIIDLSESLQDFSTSTLAPQSTFNNHSNNSLHSGDFKATDVAVKMPTSADTLNRQDISDTLHTQPPVISDRPANIHPIVPPSHVLGPGQTEQMISFSDIFNDIKRIQLHNMRQFAIHNNNFNTMNLGEAHEKGNHLLTSVITRMNTLPPVEITHPHHMTTAAPQELNGQAELNDVLDAMLVLSVDDILADHTMLHGAIVLSRRSDSSNSSK